VTVATLSAAQLDVAGACTAVIDTSTVAGAAAPPVLLLHGSGPGVTAAANWRPVIPVLSADRRVIAPAWSRCARSSACSRTSPG
jgi:pimeloyl-ACP methyl ester carboxylesterase